MPYPNRIQWWILWVTVLTAAWNWLGLDLTRFLYGNHGRWEWDGYLGRAAYWHPTRFAISILAVGLLLTWQASAWTRRKPTAPTDFRKPVETSATTSPDKSVNSPEFWQSALKEVRDYHADLVRWERDRKASQK